MGPQYPRGEYMSMSIGYVVSYTIAIVAVISLSGYFFREYSIKKMQTSLAWSFGFLFYGIAQIAHLSADVLGDVRVGKPVFGIGMMMLVFAITLFYYGTSLLFFDEGSFLREGLPVIIFLGYTAYSIVILIELPLEGFVEGVAPLLSLGEMMPMFLVIAAPFYYTSKKLDQSDPRKHMLLLLFTGWFFVAVSSAYIGTSLGFSGITDSMIYMLQMLAWLLILYGMIVGKAAKR